MRLEMSNQKSGTGWKVKIRKPNLKENVKREGPKKGVEVVPVVAAVVVTPVELYIEAVQGSGMMIVTYGREDLTR